MKINSQKILDSLNNNGGIITTYGDSLKSNIIKTLKNSMLAATFIGGFSVSASALPNHEEQPSGRSIETTQSAINPSQLDNTFNNNYIVLSNLKSGEYELVESELQKENHMAEDIVKDKRDITTIMKEVQKQNHLETNKLVIPEFGVTIDKDESAEDIQKKLLEVSETHPDEDVRVRSKVMAFIITNEGLSSNTGLDAQNHFTIGYGYDVDEQVKSRTNSQVSKEFAKKHVYKELASAGIDVGKLTNAYKGTNYKVPVTAAQATMLSAKTMSRYLAFAKTAAGPNLWGLTKENDVKPADFYRKNWTMESNIEKGGVFNSYFVLNDRMKAAYVYSTYNFGPSSFGKKVRSYLEKGNHHSAVHAISSTWKDKNGVVHTNYRWMNNMAFAMSSDQTMMTFINKESDKYIKTDIRQALSGESPDVEMILRLTERYNQNIYAISQMDIKEMKGETLSEKEQERHKKLSIQSAGLLDNINKKKVSIGEKPLQGYDKNKHLINFDKMQRLQTLGTQYNIERSEFNQEKLKEYDEKMANLEANLPLAGAKITNHPFGDKLKQLFLNNQSANFAPSESLRDNKDLEEIKKIAIEKQEEEIKQLRSQQNKSAFRPK